MELSEYTMATARNAAKAIRGYLDMPKVMDFVLLEALRATAADLRASRYAREVRTRGKLLAHKRRRAMPVHTITVLREHDPRVDDRVKEYIQAGLLGVYAASLSPRALALEDAITQPTLEEAALDALEQQ